MLEPGEHLRIDHRCKVKLDSKLREHFDFAQALDQGQLVFGDPVCIQTSRQRARVVELGADAAAAQFGRASERGRPGADQCNREPRIGPRRKGQGSTAGVQRVHREALQARNLDRLLIEAVHHAGAFAQNLHRAGAGAACAQNIGVENGAGGPRKIAAGDLLNKARNIDMRRTCAGAGRIEAEEATIGLWNRSLFVERRMQIAETRGGLRMVWRLLHKGRLAAHRVSLLPPLSTRKPSLCTIRGQN